jgi:hypothetical protein
MALPDEVRTPLKGNRPMNRMLSAALVAATMAGVSGSAHAGISCNLTDQHNNTLSYTFARGGSGYTNEISVRRNGAVLSNGGPMWNRRYDQARRLMVLEQAGWNLVYEAKSNEAETSQASLFFGDVRKASGVCFADHSMDTPAPTYVAPAPTPQYVAPAPQTPYIAPPQHADRTAVPLTTPDNWFSQFTTISVNNKWIKVQVDTGAYGMTMTQSLADAMVNNGDATRGEDSQVKGYDGVSQNVHHITIHTLTFGGRDIADVDAVVVPDSGNPLLGMDVLRRFGKSTIDTAASQLILG